MNDNPRAIASRQRRDRTFNGLDGDFHFIDWGGDGPLIHMAHATGMCAGLYSPLSEKLSDHLHVIGMDDRGHGKTTTAAIPKKLKDWYVFSEDLEHFLEYLDTPVIGMGHSRGGVATLLLAIKRPDLIRALILIDPTILPPSWMWKWRIAKRMGLARFVPIAARAARRKRIWPDRATMLTAYSGKGMFKTWEDGFLEAYIADGTEKTDRGTIQLRCSPAWESKCYATCPHDVWRFIPKLEQPILVVYGSESDTFLPEAAAQFQSDLPHAQMKCIENTSHFVPMEKPDETIAAILSFLRYREILN